MYKETNEIIKEIFKMYEDMALDSNLSSLIKTLKEWYFEKEDYKSRIDKALEEIDNYIRLCAEPDLIYLEDILRGED